MVDAAQPGAHVTAPLLTRSFVLLIVAHFLQALGYSSMLLLPLYLQHLDASRTAIGAIMAVAAVSGLATRPLVAWGLDSWGRKPTLVLGTLLLTGSMALVGAVDRIGVVIYLHRIIAGIGIGALFSGYFTFAADLIPETRRTEGLALFGISGLVPLLVNPLSDQLGIASADVRWFLPLVGAVIALSLVALLAIPEPRKASAERLSLRDAVTALRQRPLWSVWLATFAFAGLVSVFMIFATVAAERRGVEQAPSLWLTYALGAVTVRLFGARLPDRLGPANLMAPALGCYIGAMLYTAQASCFSDFLLAALIAGVGHGYAFPVLAGQVVSRTPVAFRGSALSLFTALWVLSELLVSPAFGAIADRYDDGSMFLSAALMGIICLVLWLLLEHRYGRSLAAKNVSSADLSAS